METWETLTMSRKEVPRVGLLKAALARRITTAQGALALDLSVRQFQRLKRRYAADGPRGCCTACAAGRRPGGWPPRCAPGRPRCCHEKAARIKHAPRSAPISGQRQQLPDFVHPETRGQRPAAFEITLRVSGSP
jgi:hypothetical protein